MSRFGRILVATDGSASCQAATDAAIDLAAALGAELVALSVAHAPDATDTDLSSSADPIGAAEAAGMTFARDEEASVEAAAADHAARVAAEATARGIRARAVTWEGMPGASIVAAAAAEHADLIVVGSHCRGRLGRIVAGSVSDDVIHHASVPVMVVRTAPAGSPAD